MGGRREVGGDLGTKKKGRKRFKGGRHAKGSYERMSQGEKAKGTKEKKKVEGWSTEEMREKANSFLEDDTEEMRTWRLLNNEEMDQCWKKLLAERMEVQVLDKCKIEDSRREAYSGRGSQPEWRPVRSKKKG